MSPFEGREGATVFCTWNCFKYCQILDFKKSQIMQKDIVDTADGTTLRRVKTPLWKCTLVEVNFFQEMSSHGVVSDKCDIRNKKSFFFQNLTQQVIRLCDTSTRCATN